MKKIITCVIATVVVTIATPALAYADSPVKIGGITDAWVEATAKVSTSTVSIKSKNKTTGTGIVTCHYRFLGIPIPNTCYWTNSFPTIYKQPSLYSAKGSLNSRIYAQSYNNYLGRIQWQVKGSQNFAGDVTSTIIGKAVGKTKGTGYFYAGHDNCPFVTCTEDHAIKKLTVKA